MMEKTIRILDPIHCKANPSARKIIKHCLAYNKSFWFQGDHHMESEINKQYLITGRDGSSGHFLTGLLPKVKKYCKNLGVKIKITGKLELFPPQCKPLIDGIEFRPDQIKAIRAAKRKYSGIIKAPTGSGKTIVMMGICSMFPNSKILILAHLKDLIYQIEKETNKFKLNLPPVYYCQGADQINKGIKKIRNSKNGILLTLIQSFGKIPPKEYMNLFDIIIIDEAHHVNSTNSKYGKVLTNSLSPRRYGFTASPPTNDLEQLYNEGLIGPIIAELTFQEALSKGIIAKPNIRLEIIEYNQKLNKECEYKYQNYYTNCICLSKQRNSIIAQYADKSLKEKIPTIIIVEKLDHGKAIQKKIKSVTGKLVPFASGSSIQDERNKYKNDLLEGKIFLVIVSRIWMEGINIPNLEIIIYAAGMKEKKRAIQAMGRGLRTTKNKKEIILVDFLDPYRYLAEHTVSRLQVYKEAGWI